MRQEGLVEPVETSQDAEVWPLDSLRAQQCHAVINGAG